MISVADLLTNNRIPGNYFDSNTYVKGELEMGLLENRRGDRLLAIPETFIQGMYAGLDKETGQAYRLVLLNCGRWWGKSFYTHFREELTDYYGTSLADMPMVEFLQCLRQCWTTYGWGKLELDQSFQSRGFLIIKTWNSPFAAQALKSTLPACHLELGVLIAFFSQLSGRELDGVQISCESLGADCNRFLLGLAKRVKPAEAMVERQMDADAIMQQLCA